jgi:DNA-binding MarR family transcriptional regulator
LRRKFGSNQYTKSKLLYLSSVAKAPARTPTADTDCTPPDSVDALLESWARTRRDLDFEPVAVITRLARIRRHLDRELEPVFERFGLSPATFEALVTLMRIADGRGVSQKRLADEIGVTPGTISVRVDHLVAEGLAERRADPESKRSSLVALTERGRAVFERVAPAHLANERRLLASLSDEDRRALVGLLRKLLVEFEGSAPIDEKGRRLGVVLTPAHVTMELRESVGLPEVAGLLVRSVEPGSPAAEAGIEPGDLLIGGNGRELRSSSSLYAAVRESGDGPLKLKLLRGSDDVEVRVQLKATEKDAATSAEQTGRPGEHCV